MGKQKDINRSLRSDTPPSVAQSVLRRRANEHRKNPTEAEKAMMHILDGIGVRYVFQSISFSPGTYRIFDFYLPRLRIVIEVDGPYHDTQKDQVKDYYVKLKHKRFRILRFTNAEVLQAPEQCRVRVQAVIAQKKALRK